MMVRTRLGVFREVRIGCPSRREGRSQNLAELTGIAAAPRNTSRAPAASAPIMATPEHMDPRPSDAGRGQAPCLTCDASSAELEHSRLLRVTTKRSAGRASPTCHESVTRCDDLAQNHARLCSADRRTASTRPGRSYVVAMGIPCPPHEPVRSVRRSS